MDYYLLTDLAAQVGHGLAISGAETFRVEDTIRRILRAYGIECEVFAIPNCLTISFEAANGNGDRVVPVSTADYYANAAGPVAPRPVHSALDLSKLELIGFHMPDWEDELEEYLFGSSEKANMEQL